MFGWKPLIAGAALIGVGHVYLTYKRASHTLALTGQAVREEPIQKKTIQRRAIPLGGVVTALESHAHAMVEREPTTRVQVYSLPQPNTLRVTFSTTNNVKKLSAFERGMKKDISRVVCDHLPGSALSDDGVAIEMVVETKQYERATTFQVTEVMCQMTKYL